MKRYLLFIAFSLFLMIQGNAQTDTIKLFYAVDYSEITNTHQKLIEEYLSKKNLSQLVSVEINGYTDTTASVAYNKVLSNKRATNAKNYVTKKINASIKNDFYGELKSKFPKDMQIDRRVDIIFHYQIKEENNTTTIKDFYKISTLQPQEFCIQNNRDTVIRCSKGTIIYIKANSFSLNGNKITNEKCVTFQVKEAFLNSEMILENLSTTSDGRILETQGMVYTNALLDNQKLELIRDIIIAKPTDKVVENVKVFEGNRDAHSDIINWTLENNSVLRNFSIAQVMDCPTVDHSNPCGVWYANGSNRRMARLEMTPECLDYLLKERGFGGDCMVCHLFFCRVLRIPKGIAGTFNKRIKEENKEIRRCVREARRYKRLARKMRRNGGFLKDFQIRRILNRRINFLKSKKDLTKEEKEALEIMEEIMKSDEDIQNKKIIIENRYACEELDSLFKTYGVTNTTELVKALNQPLMKEFNVSTMEELMTVLPQANLKNIELSYLNKSVSYEDFKYYIFNSSKLGWKNLDVFADLSQDQLTQIVVNLKPEKYLDCKLVFKSRKFVLPAELENSKFVFKGIPKGEEAYLVALKYANGIPMLDLHTILIDEKEYEVSFKEYTLEQLKQELKVLDFD